MDLVSRYCFSEGEPPEPELVAKLMGYVTRLKKGTEKDVKKTKRFTPFEEDCIDPNPVVRSFLLKLLLRSSVNEAVFKHLEDHLAQAKTFLKTPQENIEFLAICIQCIEDFHHNQVLQSGTEPHLALVKGAVKSLDLAVNEYGQPTSGIDVAQMVAVAHARFGLVVTAEEIRVFYGGSHQQNEKQQQSQPEVFRESKKLFAMAKTFSESTENEWPNIFLLKQLCRRYGTMCLKSAVEHLDLEWIMPSDGHSQNT
ncbi:E3 ubiquitin-protein ligase RNF213-like [Ptychodera flava]|uniref:E3 ubiquitin-protein ligase RNF213-like n=1 Tax=Ptychodera flava TaxID=63121 RepID=UPI003969F7FF